MALIQQTGTNGRTRRPIPDMLTWYSAERHDRFLESLRSNGRFEYKRYRGLPLRYAGGKSLGVGAIVRHLPPRVNCLVSPFMGGGSVEIACAKELGIKVKAFDIFDILVNYWQVQLDMPQKLAARIGRWQPDRETYKQVKAVLKAHWDGSKLIRDRTTLASHYWFNHNLSYGPGFLGWMSKIYEEEDRFHRLLAKVHDFSCPNLTVEHASFDKAISRYPEAFLYCDPPYYLDGSSRMFKGIYPQRNFPVHHVGFDHAKLRTMLANHRGGFILSYNDCDEIRDWYRDYEIVEVAWQYTLGQGETRIGKNRVDNGVSRHTKQSHELLIVRHP